MPTESFKSILDRDLSRAMAKDTVEPISELLQVMVNDATWVLARCDQATSGNIDEDVAVFALYRHVIEMTDGVDILMTQSCPTPAIGLVRSSFEALISMEYILESAANYARRSLSWISRYVHTKLASYESFDPSTTRGMKFRSALEIDKAGQNVDIPDLTQVRIETADLQSVLSQPHFQDVENEFKRIGQLQKRSPPWHRLFNGPSTIEQLALHVNRPAQYEILYRRWPMSTHAADFSQLIVKAADDRRAIKRLREPGDILDVASFAPILMISATQLMIEKFRPGEMQRLSQWYKREVRDRFREVTRYEVEL